MSDPRTDPGVRVRGPEVGSLTSRLLSTVRWVSAKGAAASPAESRESVSANFRRIFSYAHGPRSGIGPIDLSRDQVLPEEGGMRPPWRLIPLLIPRSAVSPGFLQARIDRFAFERQHAENALVNASQRLSLNEPFESLDAQRELSEAQ